MAKSLKKLSRMELLQLLLKASESNEALINENTQLKQELARRAAQPPAQAAPAQAPVQQQAVKVGSIAEAALQANGFFEAAQRSADDYLRQIKQMRDQMAARNAASAQQQGAAGPTAEEIARRQAQAQQSFEQIQAQAKTYIQDVQTYANNVMARANQQAEALVVSAQAQASDMLAQAQTQAEAIVAQANEQASQVSRMVGQPAAEPQAQGADQIFGYAETQPQALESQETGRIETSPGILVAEAVEPLPEQVPQAAATSVAPDQEAVPTTAPVAYGQEAVPMAAPAANGQEAVPMAAPVVSEQETAPEAAPIASEQETAFDTAATGELYRRGRHVRPTEGTGA